MADHVDPAYMRRCLELASLAAGNSSPNPLVGSVIVHEGLIIGEGYHLKAGTPHAEVNAVNSVADRSMLSRSTLYVNLEPCSHFGRTPPCADMIIASGIRRVVIGTEDTSAKVAGRGIKKMREAGIEVITGVEEEASRELNRRFFTSHEKGRPWVVLKWARSADGFIDLVRAPEDPAEPHWITGRTERILVHRWRSEEDAILVGGATVRNDNPSLDVRLWNGRNPARIIVSHSGEIDHNSKVLNDTADIIMFTRNKKASLKRGMVITLKSDRAFPAEILQVLHERGFQSVFIEGGAYIIGEFIRSGLWDEARRFTGTVRFGNGIPDPWPGFVPGETFRFDSSILEIARNF